MKKKCKDYSRKKNVVVRILDAAIEINSKITQVIPGTKGLADMGTLLKDKK